MKKALIFALLSFGMVLGGVSHAKEYKSMTVRIACSTPPGSVQAVPLARLAEIVHKESNGKIKCELYTGGVLGDEQAVVKQLRKPRWSSFLICFLQSSMPSRFSETRHS